MSDNTPEQIKQQIEHTRADLSDNVNALGDKVSPSHMMGRQMDRARDTATGLKERVMGSAGDMADSGADTARSAQSQMRRKAKGNPLAAGLIAFGAGWLLSSVLPASEPEQQAAAQLKDKASDVAQPMMEQAKQAGQEMADNLKQPAQEATEHVRATAQDAAGNVSDQARHAAGDVKEDAQQQTQ